MKRDLVIIVTGIHNENFVPKAIDLMAWSLRWRGVEAEVFRMHWQSEKKYEKKESELRKLIIKRSKDFRVSLVGISAGTIPCLNLLVELEEIHRVITASGWSMPIDKENRKYFEALGEVSESFVEGVKKLSENLNLMKLKIRKVWAFRTKDDEFVPYKTAAIVGSKITDVEVRGHVRAISFALIGYRREIVDFIKQR